MYIIIFIGAIVHSLQAAADAEFDLWLRGVALRRRASEPHDESRRLNKFYKEHAIRNDLLKSWKNREHDLVKLRHCKSYEEEK